MIYKVTTERVIYVEASTAEEAEDKVFDDDELCSEERITNVKKSSRKEIGNFFKEI